MPFPDAAISVLRKTRWSADATREYDLLSGGFLWSDEGLREVTHICMDADNWAFRKVIAYRASLIRNEPRDELREPWDQLACSCPNWPGFLPEIVDIALRDELDAVEGDAIHQCEHVSNVIERAKRINAIREKQKRKWWRLW